jgi:hypothetical protein
MTQDSTTQTKVFVTQRYGHEASELNQRKGNRNLPQHIAIIMDGNRRFAKSCMMPSEYGHIKGKETLENVVRCVCTGAEMPMSTRICFHTPTLRLFRRWVLVDLEIRCLTVYALSIDNLRKRSQNELNVLFELFIQARVGASRAAFRFRLRVFMSYCVCIRCRSAFVRVCARVSETWRLCARVLPPCPTACASSRHCLLASPAPRVDERVPACR